MIEKIKQYRNLIFLVLIIAAAAGIMASDPLGHMAQRRYERAAIMNRAAIEKAETEKRVAILEAEKEAEIKRIEMEAYMPDAIILHVAREDDMMGEGLADGDTDSGEGGTTIWLIRN